MATFGGFKLTLVSLIEAVKLVHLNKLVFSIEVNLTRQITNSRH